MPTCRDPQVAFQDVCAPARSGPCGSFGLLRQDGHLESVTHSQGHERVCKDHGVEEPHRVQKAKMACPASDVARLGPLVPRHPALRLNDPPPGVPVGVGVSHVDNESGELSGRLPVTVASRAHVRAPSTLCASPVSVSMPCRVVRARRRLAGPDLSAAGRFQIPLTDLHSQGRRASGHLGRTESLLG